MTRLPRWILILSCAALPANAQRESVNSSDAQREYTNLKMLIEEIVLDLSQISWSPPEALEPSRRKDLQAWRDAKAKYPRAAAPFEPCVAILLEEWQVLEEAAHLYGGERHLSATIRINALIKQANELAAKARPCLNGVPNPFDTAAKMPPLEGVLTHRSSGPPGLAGGIQENQTQIPVLNGGVSTDVRPPVTVIMDQAVIDWAPWYRQLGLVIESDFYRLAKPYPGDPPLTCQIDYTVTRSGSFQARLTRPSGMAAFDQAVLNLVNQKLNGNRSLYFPMGTSVKGVRLSSFRDQISNYFTFTVTHRDAHLIQNYAEKEYLTLSNNRWSSEWY